jgi:hypothetical protein
LVGRTWARPYRCAAQNPVEHVSGVLDIHSHRTVAFDDDSRSVATCFGSYAAVALDDTDAYENARALAAGHHLVRTGELRKPPRRRWTASCRSPAVASERRRAQVVPARAGSRDGEQVERGSSSVSGPRA